MHGGVISDYVYNACVHYRLLERKLTSLTDEGNSEELLKVYTPGSVTFYIANYITFTSLSPTPPPPPPHHR